VQALLAEGEVASDLRQLILDRAAGNPLFLEELTHTLLENGSIRKQNHTFTLTRPPSQIQVPDTIQGVIAARMDRLEEAMKRILQVASVIGRDFAFRILQAISGMQEELKSHLRNLQGLEFIYEKSLFPELEYIFKHALIQEVAYNSLLLKRRRESHEKIGLAIEDIYAERVEEFYEMLAYHFERAGAPEKAVKYLHLAGQRAVRLLANEEAIAHFNRALELLHALPEGGERDAQELALQLGLFAPLLATRGWAPPELGRACSRALELCRQMGEDPQTFTVLVFLRYYYVCRGENRIGLELAKQAIDLAQRSQDRLQLLGAHCGMGISLMHLGEWQEARMHLEQVIASYDPGQHRDLALVYGCDLGAYAHSYRAWALWYLGYPDQAVNQIQEAVAFARELNHPFSLGFVLVNGGEVHACAGDPHTFQRYAEEAMRLSKEGGFFLLQAWATFHLGWARAQQGEVEEGIAQMRQGLEGWRSMGMEVAIPFFLARMAEAYGKAGRAEEGLELAEEALDLVEKTGERAWEAEAYWAKGDLLQSSAKMEAAEACFRQVIQVARRQEAKSWELRATLSLSLLLREQGRSEEARQLLSKIYGWFTEGFDTPDLQEARVLLDALEVSP
jgi:predicted ATPase